MPYLASIATIDFPSKVKQEDVKEYASRMFSNSFPEINRMMPVFDNTGIKMRNLCKPLDYYYKPHSFHDRNLDFIEIALSWSVKAIEECLERADTAKDEVTDILFISSTGLATPSMDALIINRMKLPQTVNRMSVFGLGCGGGVSGYAKACNIAKSNPKANVLLVAVELCSLTFMRDDYSKSNFIGTTLFSDGIAACLIAGDDRKPRKNATLSFIDNGSKIYYDTLDIMGWEFMDHGFKVLFSPGIPSIIEKYVKRDITDFLSKNGLKITDINNFIFHPGGKKVLAAYEQALEVKWDFLGVTRDIMADYGNMSSTTVLYVLKRFMKKENKAGYSLMASMGPGFSCEMVLLEIK